MAMSGNNSLWLGLAVVLVFIATPVAAFGAGDITEVASINNVNYRHGDIENTLLELIMAAGSSTKFEKLDVKRVYFGNWLRDYSQAIDVGGLKQLPADTIRILLWCLSFITFGYATGEFEVTAERLGCYRPEEHIDNPKDYADNEDARKYDKRLRAPVDEGKELKVDPETGLKVYIASEKAGIETSAGLVRKLFGKSIELGRKYHKENNKADFYEALRLLGTGLHCLEDFAAHSNYTELALKELGVDAFPHVGKKTQLDVKGKKIFPLVTGTFGMTDFLHSVVGEMGDKVAQSEVEDMESKLNNASEEDDKNDQTSILKEILDKVPWDFLEGDDKPDPAKADELKKQSAAKAEDAKQHPLDPNATLGGVNIEEAKKNAQQTLKDMYPILEFHDQIMKGVNAVTSKVPGLDDLMENMSGALQIFIFSLLSPYIKPIIAQARVELKSSSEGVLKSSEKGQYEVFENESCTDPTHSMLSKDHFSNVLNPVAGQIACATVKFVVPHIVEAWSDEGKDARQVIDDILQVFHHPALRDENKAGQKAMYETVKAWWEGKDDSDKQHLKDILSFQGVKDGKNHEGETEEGGHSHGAPPKKKDEGIVPSAQEGASLISGLAGGLTNMALESTGLDQKFGKVDTSSGQGRQEHETTQESGSYSRGDESQSHQQQQTGSNSYGRSEQPSYSQETSSYGRGNDNETRSSGLNDNEGSSYGRNEGSSFQDSNTYGGSRNDDNNESSYGRNTQTESSSYGQNTSGYGDNDTTTSSYGREEHSTRREETQESSYGGGNSYGESGRNESSGYDGREETSYGGGDRQESSYGGREEASYGSGDRQESGYGGREETSYGGGDRQEGEYGSREDSGYQGGRRQQDDESRY